MNQIAHYRIEGEIGRGGMGVVYRAVDVKLGRPLAIKILSSEATGDPERNQRFVREAQAASALNHPNIVTIYEIGEDAGTTFIAMELVEGTPLDHLLARAPLPVVTALQYGLQIAAALKAAHARGIVHRDIKPANIVITSDGHAKVLDFGLAKLVERGPTEATITDVATQAGTIMGTAAYMSPEQAESRVVTPLSDIFSFGAVLYEMLAGRRPFRGGSNFSAITAILRDQPPPLRTVRPDVPGELEAVITRTLAKDPAARYQSAEELRADLAAIHEKLTRPPDRAWRRPAVVVPVVVVLLAVAAFGLWQTWQIRRARWARQVAIPEIERLQFSDRSLAALPLMRDSERFAPEEVARIRQGWTAFSVTTDPADALVEIKNYADVDGGWTPLGPSPVRTRLPMGLYRVRLAKPGYQAVELSVPTIPPRGPIKLVRSEDTPKDMVFVLGGRYSVGVAKGVALPDFWIDKFEVTNEDYKRFVDAGGYRDQKYWKHPFTIVDDVLGFDAAMLRFRDPTGRPGPSTWEFGTYPEGQAQFPVGGISWFEAGAYAEFAGKSLPSIHHWFKASGVDDMFSGILRFSNFDGKGAARVGERRGIGPWGTLDTAGNVKEWCFTQVEGPQLRYILGGGWNEPNYRFRDAEARDPWSRHAAHGLRLVKNLGPVGDSYEARSGVHADPRSLVPVSDAEYAILTRFYAYEPAPLNARVTSTDASSSPYWTKETLSFDAAYGGERVSAYLVLPKNIAAPFQAIVFLPTGYAFASPSSEQLDHATFEFMVRSGRAVLYPVYKGTFERGGGRPPQGGMRDMLVHFAKDFFRAVDYLESRPDVAKDKLGAYGLSAGARLLPIPLALEPRIKAAVAAGGSLPFRNPPETQTTNFMPRVKMPFLLINGRDDFSSPLHHQRRFIELIGTPDADKKHVTLEGGQVPDDLRAMFRAALEWFDRYLGPVK